MQTLDQHVHLKLQAEVLYGRVKHYKGRWCLLTQCLVTIQERTFCLSRLASSSIGCVRPARREGQPFVKRELQIFLVFAVFLCGGKCGNSEFLHRVLFSPLLCARVTPIIRRRLDAEWARGAVPLLPQRQFTAGLVQSSWTGLSSCSVRGMVVLSVSSNGKSQSSEITFLPHGSEV